MELNTSKQTSQTKIIKRYQNRKLYDTQQSCYVTLDDISKMIRLNEEIIVIDNKSKSDITSGTLTQIIFETEKRALQFPPISILREVIQHGSGNLSGYLAKLGAFPIDQLSKPISIKLYTEQVIVSDTLRESNLGLNFISDFDSSSRTAAEKARLGDSQDLEDPILPGAKLEF